MPHFARLIRFTCSEDGEPFFADIGTAQGGETPPVGARIRGYQTLGDLTTAKNDRMVTMGNLLAPTPDPELPIYCVGLNYQSHAIEAKMSLPRYPPLWTKPKAALANPDEDIPISRFCAENLLDYEGELVFITSKECRDVSVEEADSCILGYTVGNDLSCRAFQAPSACAGQFFFAKAFDKFAPIGPSLTSHEEFCRLGDRVRLTTKVNGETVQSSGGSSGGGTTCLDELVFSPAEILSHMSRSTTVPAYTAVMTGTPAGVGLFRNDSTKSGGTFLQHGDVVEVELTGVGVLRNRMVFE